MPIVEQRLREIMSNKIIGQYVLNKRPGMKALADQVHPPYWDWAVKEERTKDGEMVLEYNVPRMVKQKMVTISLPQGGETTVDNPFYNFKADDALGEFSINAVEISDNTEDYEAIPFARARTTSCFQDDPNKDRKVMDDFGSPKFELAGAVNRRLAPGWFNTYRQFVTTSRAEAEQDGKYWLSLEGIHNFSHMADVPFAAFDPIFYLHHADVDRLLAIWAELNPKQWWTEDEIKGRNSETIRKITPTDSLKPFHVDTKGSFYSPDSSRRHFDLGYTYPELQPWNFASEKEYQEKIETTIDKMYAPPASTQLVISNHSVVVNVSFERRVCPGWIPFTVRVYPAGEPVGEAYNFSFVAENCQNQQATNAVVAIQVFITEELIEAVKDPNKTIKNLLQEAIAFYVKANLSWKALRASTIFVNGKEANTPSLEVVPFIGRRKLHRVPAGTAGAPESDEHEGIIPSQGPLEGGIIGMPGIEIRDVAYLEGEWDDEMKTIVVRGTHTLTPHRQSWRLGCIRASLAIIQLIS
ncbi:tyrosinase [Coprinopsis sp. MPI-PUGE-AT-0042]|nr:tyrosinase [Coprinopsis sp. MPI-PUGE-AT-0042]